MKLALNWAGRKTRVPPPAGTFPANSWRSGRAAEGSGLENRRGEIHRGFESLLRRSYLN